MITIKHIDTTETVFPNREKSAVIVRAEQSKQLMSEDVLNVEIISAESIDFKIGDYIEAFGQTYTLNQLPSPKKENARRFNYSLIFEGEIYELLDAAWLLPDNTTGDSFTGNLGDFLSILIGNVQRSHSDWVLGSYPTAKDTIYKTLTFTDSNCLQSLQNICKEFEVEFEVSRNNAQRVLTIKNAVGTDLPYSFRYGRTGGTYNIQRKTNSNKNVVTRLYAFGSSNNIPSRYRYSKLCLPGKVKNQSYIENQNIVNVFGHRENVHNFDTIKPERKGSITQVDSVVAFRDSTMDFDLNETDNQGNTKWLIPGNAAKVEFLTGNLAGYSFEITKYEATNKDFHLKQFRDENGLIFPNPDSAAFQFAVGDEYFISGINLPDSYITAAENKLQTEAEKYYNEYCKPHVDYNIELNSQYLKKLVNAQPDSVVNVFNPGDNIRIIDDDLAVDSLIRVTKFTRDLLTDQYAYKLTLSDSVQYTALQRIIGELSTINEVIKMNDLTNAAKARANWRTMQEVLDSVFDTEGHYYSEKIRPLSIETSMLRVGSQSQQFILRDMEFTPNYGGNTGVLVVSNGVLDHYTIDDDGVKSWTLTGNTFSGLSANAAYYLYAKCSKSGTTGVVTCETVQHPMEDESDTQNYYFQIGVLSSVIDGVRKLTLTYGGTTISGQYIKTGQIESNTGTTVIDLDTGIIQGVFNFISGLISGEIKIGANAESAICGLGGDFLMWGKDGNQYKFYIEKNGNFRYIISKDCPNNNGFVLRIDTGTQNAVPFTLMRNLEIYPSYSTVDGSELTALKVYGRSYFDNDIELSPTAKIKVPDLVSKYFKKRIKLSTMYTGDKVIYLAQSPVIMALIEISYVNGAFAAVTYGGAPREDYDNLLFGITECTRLGTGIVKITFNHSFEREQDYYIVGIGTNPNSPCFVSIKEKKVNGFTAFIADDNTPNDLPCEIKVLGIKGYNIGNNE